MDANRNALELMARHPAKPKRGTKVPDPGRKSPLRGVYYNRQKQKWGAKIYFGGKQVHIGFYATEADAGAAYDRKSRELRGNSTPLANFPLKETERTATRR